MTDLYGKVEVFERVGEEALAIVERLLEKARGIAGNGDKLVGEGGRFAGRTGLERSRLARLSE